MYAVHASIILPRSRFTPLKLMEEGRSERGTLKFLTRGIVLIQYRNRKKNGWVEWTTWNKVHIA